MLVSDMTFSSAFCPVWKLSKSVLHPRPFQ